MREGRPSVTARRVAVRRAAHQVLDNPKVFDDPLALAIIGAEEAAALLAAPREGEAFYARYIRAFMAARSRYAEDELAASVARGVRQYVVLGAGLDTFAYRNPHADLRVFEVDHPATQEWKRRQLEQARIAIPPSLTFAPIDFERETFADGLCRAGFIAQEPAFFSWLGVTPYLQRDTVLSTLRLIVALSPENGVVFDFAVPRSSLGMFQQIAFDAISTRVAAAGEPFQCFFDPAELDAQLRSMSFRHVEDLDSEAVNARYFQNRSDGLRVGGDLAHLLCARG